MSYDYEIKFTYFSLYIFFVQIYFSFPFWPLFSVIFLIYMIKLFISTIFHSILTLFFCHSYLFIWLLYQSFYFILKNIIPVNGKSIPTLDSQEWTIKGCIWLLLIVHSCEVKTGINYLRGPKLPLHSSFLQIKSENHFLV